MPQPTSNRINLFSHFVLPELLSQAESFAKAQDKLASDTREDRTHWHHLALAHLLRELAYRYQKQFDLAQENKVKLSFAESPDTTGHVGL